jgi:hypothetical protein
MRTMPPVLLPLLRSRVQGDPGGLLCLHPDQEFQPDEIWTHYTGRNHTQPGTSAR